MKLQRGFVPFFVIIALLIVGGGSYLFFTDRDNKEEVKSEDESGAGNKVGVEEKKEVNNLPTSNIIPSTRLSGVFNYQLVNGNPKLDFSVGVKANGEVGSAAGYDPSNPIDHFIKLTFVNQNEAIEDFNIDTSKLPKESGDTKCFISGESLAIIEVTGYNATKAEKDWSDDVTLTAVITPANSKVQCAMP